MSLVAETGTTDRGGFILQETRTHAWRGRRCTDAGENPRALLFNFILSVLRPAR